DSSFHPRVVPTFRPDHYLDPQVPDWNARVDRLGEVAGTDVSDYAGFIAALEERRRYFIAHGAVAADHGVVDAVTVILPEPAAARVYGAARAGQATEAEAGALRRHPLTEVAPRSGRGGLVPTSHRGGRRD